MPIWLETSFEIVCKCPDDETRRTNGQVKHTRDAKRVEHGFTTDDARRKTRDCNAARARGTMAIVQSEQRSLLENKQAILPFIHPYIHAYVRACVEQYEGSRSAESSHIKYAIEKVGRHCLNAHKAN